MRYPILIVPELKGVCSPSCHVGLTIGLPSSSPKTCHRFVGYLEEEAVKTYTHALHDIDT